MSGCGTNKSSTRAVDGISDGPTTNKTKVSTLEFEDIRFHREVLEYPPSVPETSNEHLNGAIVCEKEAVPAVCMVRAIFVTPADRRKHIATQLLDALRKVSAWDLSLNALSWHSLN